MTGWDLSEYRIYSWKPISEIDLQEIEEMRTVVAFSNEELIEAMRTCAEALARYSSDFDIEHDFKIWIEIMAKVLQTRIPEELDVICYVHFVDRYCNGGGHLPTEIRFCDSNFVDYLEKIKLSNFKTWEFRYINEFEEPHVEQ